MACTPGGRESELAGALPRSAHREAQGFSLSFALGQLQGDQSACRESVLEQVCGLWK